MEVNRPNQQPTEVAVSDVKLQIYQSCEKINNLLSRIQTLSLSLVDELEQQSSLTNKILSQQKQNDGGHTDADSKS